MFIKHFAGLCLLAALVLFVGSLFFEDAYPWLGFVRAFSEAALIGGLADWFAVVALFRHPLGIPLPHTAIIPNNQARIADSLGGFIKKNFLSDEVLAERLSDERLAEYDLPGRAADWLERPENLSRVLDEMLFSIKESIQFLNEDELKRFFSDNTADFIRNYNFTPLLGRLLGYLIEGDRHMTILEKGVEWLDTVLVQITPESSWWRVFEKLKLFTMRRELKSIAADPDHMVRRIYDEKLREFSHDLTESAYVEAFERGFKDELLNNPEIFRSIDRLWTRLKNGVLEDMDRTDSKVREQLGRLLAQTSSELLTNGAVKVRINTQIKKFFTHVAGNYRHHIADFVSAQMKSWDTAKLTRELESQVGRDLQYIRLNGTIIGGLIGLAIHTVLVLAG